MIVLEPASSILSLFLGVVNECCLKETPFSSFFCTIRQTQKSTFLRCYSCFARLHYKRNEKNPQ